MPVSVTVEAIHSGMTGNFNYYSRSELQKAAETWLRPYNKPVLKHHNMESEPLGRVSGVNFRQSSLKRGAYCTELKLDIVDPDAAQKIADGRYSTVSVGTIVTSAVCSICKNDWVKGVCEHRKGQVYDGKLCYWHLQIGEHVEVSFVNHPADPYAQVASIGEASMEPVMGEEAGNIQDRGLQESEMERYVKEMVGAFQSEEEDKAPETPVAEGQPTTPEGDQSSEVQELRRRLEAVEAKVAELDAKLGEAAAKLGAALEQNVELARIVHEEMVQHYCDLALQAGLFANREEAEAAAREMPVRKLRAEILRLSAEPARHKVEAVQCPGGEGKTLEQPAKERQVYTLKDLEESMLALLAK
jgi:hypothetical protein